MREHKYRAWDKEEKKMYQCVTIACTQKDMWQPLVYTDTHIINGLDNDYELIEYTGLKDGINFDEKEIYEGDIIKCFWNEKVDDYNSELWSDIAKVYFDLDKGMWVAEEFKTTGEIYPLYDYCEYVEVIGNIYQNPELLKN